MPSKSSPHALTFIFITVLIDTIGFGIILPVTPQLIMELTGQGVGEASIAGGWLAFSCAIAQFLCEPITGPLIMTQLFGYFASASAPVHFPGAAFIFAALLTVASIALFLRAIRVAESEVP